MKKVGILFIILFSIASINVMSVAIEDNHEDYIYLQSSNTEIKNGEEFSFTINLANISVSAFDIHIYFNHELLEYIAGPENTNVVGDEIITVWYDETGGENAKQNCELVKYTFKAKQIETEYIAIQGEFYNAEGVQIQNFTDGIEVVANEEEQIETIEISEESQVPSNHSKLSVLRLNHEGMTPVFSPDITQYYFLTQTLSSLEVTAIPENPNADVRITGNTDFKEGLNTITIEVESPDKSSKTQYIIFVTKTRNMDTANANLETLAIENVTIAPDFTNDVYQYDATVSNTTQDLNVLAIPEKQNAKVEIVGGKGLAFGNNFINIRVVAENGYTTKQYTVNVYKRNEEEQKMAEQETENNIQKLNAILEQQEGENEDTKHRENDVVANIKENIWFVFMYVVFSMIIIVVVIVRIKKDKMDKTKKND